MTRLQMFLITLLFCFFGAKAEDFSPDSVVYNTTFYYPINSGDCLSKSDYKKSGRLLEWIKSNPGIPILIVGCCDNSGNPTSNDKLALKRAKTVFNYLERKGIDKNLLSIKGYVYPNTDIPASQLRKAEVYGYVVVEPKANERVTVEPKKENETVESIPQTVINEQPKQEPSVSQSENRVDEPVIEKPNTEYKWYFGIGGGVSFGRCTFVSFAMDKTHIGKNASVFAGYKINKLLSAELSFDYTSMTLATYDCCQNLYLGSDGNRYFAPVTGMQCYKYTDLFAKTNLYGLGAHLNIDFLSLMCENSKWSLFASPALYGIVSNTTLLKKESSFHLGAGVDLGAGYKISPRLGIRLSTGIDFLSGKSIDSLPKEEHKTNYIWNSRLGFTYGF